MPECQRLQTIPGIAAVSATALIAAIGDVTQFKNGRQLAAWLGLVQREHSTGGKPRLLGISKRGDRYLRKLLAGGSIYDNASSPSRSAGNGSGVYAAGKPFLIF
jgi:transposase